MDVEAAAEDIRSMRVRGAARIGRHAAAALGAQAETWDGRMESLEEAARHLVAARPSAVSLPNAVAFVLGRVRRAPQAARRRVLKEAAEAFVSRAESALDDLARHGATLVPEGGTIVTICHSQGALRPLIEAHRAGKRFDVVALETRPWRQGLLSARQLHEAGVRVSMAVDNAAWSILADADLVVFGADSVALNGDVVNKIGTGGLALLAQARNVPAYSCFETFKLHPTAETGAQVAIEERETAEVVEPGDLPEGVPVRNPVFDVTPSRLLRGYVTELGILSARDVVAAARKAWEMA